MLIGHLLRLYRQEHDLTLRKLADRIGVSYMSLQRLETGREVSPSAWVAIVKWVLCDEPTSNQNPKD